MGANMPPETVKHLELEHREAERLLNAFGSYLEDLRADPQIDSREASALITYLAEVFFLRHEEKEEVLVEEILRAGCRSDDPALVKQAQEHARGREVVGALMRAFAPGKAWSPEDRSRFLGIGATWREFMVGHMKREERYLFPGVHEWLTDGRDELVVQQFARIDRDYVSGDSEGMRVAAETFVDHAARKLWRQY